MGLKDHQAGPSVHQAGAMVRQAGAKVRQRLRGVNTCWDVPDSPPTVSQGCDQCSLMQCLGGRGRKAGGKSGRAGAGAEGPASADAVDPQLTYVSMALMVLGHGRTHACLDGFGG